MEIGNHHFSITDELKPTGAGMDIAFLSANIIALLIVFAIDIRQNRKKYDA
jgi:hypothetical protein